MRKLLTVWLLTISMFVLAASFAYAAGPIISSASIDYSTNQITVKGSGFSTSKPAVVFNGTALTVVGTPTSTSVTAQLPSGVSQGTCTLTVSNSAVFDVTYGAVGPVGPQGPQGATGATGATGPQGPAGPTYAGIVVVHTGPADGVSTFNSINAAIAAAPNALIEVKPGTYNESISLDYGKITIQGSGGSETAGRSIEPAATQIYGTIQAGAISLKNITVTGDVIGPKGVYLDRVSVNGNVNAGQYISMLDSTALRISAATGLISRSTFVSLTMLSGSNIIRGDLGFEISNSTVNVGTDLSALSLLANPGWVNVRNVKIVAFRYGSPLAITIARDTYYQGYGDKGKVSIINTSIEPYPELYGSLIGFTSGIKSTFGFDLIGSSISASSDAITNNSSMEVHLINSQIAGTIVPGTAGVQTINCYDGAYNLISNN